jgi:RNA polymerase sigma-70 factor (ECF subfamily)
MNSDYPAGEDRNSDRRDDAALARDVARHDPNAVAQLFSTYSEPVTRYIYHVAPNITETDSQDIMQDTFIAVLQSIKEYRAESSLSTWILRIAYFKTVDLLRKHKSLGKQESTFSEYANDDNFGDEVAFADPAPSVEDTVISGEEITLVRQLLSELPDEQRQVLTLRYVNGMRVEDVARTMGISRRMVELHITRGRAAMRRKYLEMLDRM